jgi:hypothetical protein
MDCGYVGLLHVSQISQKRVKAVEEVFKVGDRVKVMCALYSPAYSHGEEGWETSDDLWL